MKKHKNLSIDERIYRRIVRDKKHFQKVIGGKTWTINDTLREYFKILDSLEKPKKNEAIPKRKKRK